MPVAASDIQFFRSNVVNSSGTNGGTMSTTQIPNNTKNSIFNDVSPDILTSGGTFYRKIFTKVANAYSISLASTRLFIANVNADADRISFFPGTQTNTQSNLTGSETQYGIGNLNANISTGATSCTVSCKANDGQFQNGGLVRISNQPTVGSGTGTEDFIRLAASGGVGWSGSIATLNFASGQQVQYGYLAAETVVSACYEAGTVAPTWGTWNGSTASGTYDGTAPSSTPTVNVPILSAIGTVEDTWTITFSSATAFGCVGSASGNVGGGTIASPFIPNNPAFSLPYFTLPAAWAGVWSSGDYITFKTHPSAVPLWMKQIVPSSCSSLSGDGTSIGVSGASGS